jgi:hypothetical protein
MKSILAGSVKLEVLRFLQLQRRISQMIAVERFLSLWLSHNYGRTPYCKVPLTRQFMGSEGSCRLSLQV